MLVVLLLPNTNVTLMIVSTCCSLAYLLCYICISGELLTRIKQDNCSESAIHKVNALFSPLRLVMIALYFVFPSFTTIFVFGIICAILSVVFGLFSIKSMDEQQKIEFTKVQNNEVKTA